METVIWRINILWFYSTNTGLSAKRLRLGNLVDRLKSYIILPSFLAQKQSGIGTCLKFLFGMVK
jgi:hypothetical protein